MPGRAHKDPSEYQEKLCESLKAGNTRRVSCALAGISEDTLARRLADSAEFAESVKKAEAEAESSCVEVILRAATTEKTWQAAAWWLERRRPDDYGKRAPAENLSGEGESSERKLKVHITYEEKAIQSDEDDD